ncbi:MAG: helix-hairpin-helix domain-containing protein [Bacteroidales bacterium]|nr:helix-hairpin-helix domain-containing protein [Candidatus Liminaster caballi]
MRSNRHTNRWLNAAIIVLALTLIIIIYRREVLVDAYIANLEARISALENYYNDSAESDSNVPSDGNTASKDDRMPNLAHMPVRNNTPKADTKTNLKAPANQTETRTTSRLAFSDTKTNDTLTYGRKFRQPTKFELNSIDSVTLIRIPGIGAATAHMIISYRQQLGGYYSAQQLAEKITWEGSAERLKDWNENWFWTDEKKIRRLHINEASFKELVHHPYLNYDQVKAIFNWKDRHGQINNIDELAQIADIDSTQSAKLARYVEF